MNSTTPFSIKACANASSGVSQTLNNGLNWNMSLAAVIRCKMLM
jgi:hypothetical protein